MKNRVILQINNSAYTITTEKNHEYMQKIATILDGELKELTITNKIPVIRAQNMIALNYIDKYFETLDNMDNMREQLNLYIKTNERLKHEIDFLKNEKD